MTTSELHNSCGLKPLHQHYGGLLAECPECGADTRPCPKCGNDGHPESAESDTCSCEHSWYDHSQCWNVCLLCHCKRFVPEWRCSLSVKEDEYHVSIGALGERAL